MGVGVTPHTLGKGRFPSASNHQAPVHLMLQPMALVLVILGF